MDYWQDTSAQAEELEVEYILMLKTFNCVHSHPKANIMNSSLKKCSRTKPWWMHSILDKSEIVWLVKPSCVTNLTNNNSTTYKLSLFWLVAQKSIHPLLVTPFAERGRIWSRFNYWVVTEKPNYQTQLLGNKMLTSAKHTDVIVLHDNGCKLRRAQIWLVTSSFCRGDNSMVAAWPDPSSLCKGCGLQD